MLTQSCDKTVRHFVGAVSALIASLNNLYVYVRAAISTPLVVFGLIYDIYPLSSD